MLMANTPFVIFLFSLSWLVGMGIYATYFNCDPYKAGYIEKTDEILPFFILEHLTYIPGFLGLFMATLFNGSLWYVYSNESKKHAHLQEMHIYNEYLIY